MGPEFVVESGARTGRGAAADSAEHLAIGICLPPPDGCPAAAGGRVQRRGRCAAAAAGLGGHGSALGFSSGREPERRRRIWRAIFGLLMDATSLPGSAALYEERESKRGSGWGRWVLSH